MWNEFGWVAALCAFACASGESVEGTASRGAGGGSGTGAARGAGGGPVDAGWAGGGTAGGAGSPCAGSEACNGLDDDCDGQIDEDLGTVSCGIGSCATTTASCVSGAPATCTPLPAELEICDGADNDCDGQTDECPASEVCGGAGNPTACGIASGLAVSGEIAWAQGDAAVALGAVANRWCFLVRVGGHFQGLGENVRVYTSGGQWMLSGASQQTGVHARARCLSWAAGSTIASSPEYDWNQGQTPTQLGPAANQLCALTRVAGHFGGSTESVRTRVNGGSWYLDGTSDQSNVAASARCISWPAATGLAATGEASWNQGDAAVNLGGAAQRACVLTRMAGSFEGGGERVESYTSQGSWFLGGSSQQTGVAATARCLHWP